MLSKFLKMLAERRLQKREIQSAACEIVSRIMAPMNLHGIDTDYVATLSKAVGGNLDKMADAFGDAINHLIPGEASLLCLRQIIKKAAPGFQDSTSAHAVIAAYYWSMAAANLSEAIRAINIVVAIAQGSAYYASSGRIIAGEDAVNQIMEGRTLASECMERHYHFASKIQNHDFPGISLEARAIAMNLFPKTHILVPASTRETSLLH